MQMLASMEPYTAIGATIVMVLLIAIGMLVVAHGLGPRRRGRVKDSPYESGMPIVVGTDRRYNIRFYIVAILFLLFDVEIMFMWPWAVAFFDSVTSGTAIALDDGTQAGKGFLLVGMAIFFSLLLFGLVYEWKKGALEWD